VLAIGPGNTGPFHFCSGVIAAALHSAIACHAAINALVVAPNV
jgi:hypothetical protein